MLDYLHCRYYDVRPSNNNILLYVMLFFVAGKLHVQIQYKAGSQHKVRMYAEDVCVNAALVKEKLALFATPPGELVIIRLYS